MSFRPPQTPSSYRHRLSASVPIGQFGMNLALASMAALFIATIVAYWITRQQLHGWHAGSTVVPRGVYVSTATLVAASIAFQGALTAIRRNKEHRLRMRLRLGGLMAVLFLFAQGYNWNEILSIDPELQTRTLTLFTFYLLTGVHAVHVLAGFIPLAWVMNRAEQREYSSSRHDGVKFCVQYWHFLGVMWLLLLGTMLAV